MVDKIIVDADLCIKLGGSSKYTYLYDVLPLISEKIYMHTYAQGEVMMPSSAVNQSKALISEGKVILVNESGLDSKVRATYDAAYNNLASRIYKDCQESDIQTQEADIQNLKADFDRSQIYGNHICDFSAKTKEHIQMMYAELGVKPVFGRADVQKITKLGYVRASELIKALANANIIETVSGHGKGKYRFCNK